MKQRLSRKRLVVVMLTIASFVAITVAVYFATNYYALVNNPRLAGIIQTQGAVEEVGRILSLPNEQPAAYVINDVSKFQDQPILSKALPGDIFLIYASTSRGVLYRPSERKIVEIGRVNLPQNIASSPV